MGKASFLIVGAAIGVLGTILIVKGIQPSTAAINYVSVFGYPNEDDDPAVSPEKLRMAATDRVNWLASSPRKDVRVEFDEEVFENMQRKGNRFVPHCRGQKCETGAVKVKPDPKKEYKYWQFLKNADGSGPDRGKDGWIIIDRSGP